jgi:uncharacterized protein (TIRG00374 family)
MSISGSPETTSPLFDKLRRRFVYGLGFAVLVVVVFIVASDGRSLLDAFAQFDWRLLIPIILLTFGNYALRFVKWQLYLRWLSIGPLRFRTSLGIFLAGLSMAITPGKLGEFLKSYLLKRATNVPMTRSSPIVVLERITDGLSLLVLAFVGLSTVRFGWQWLLVLGVLGIGVIVAAGQRTLVARVFALFHRVPYIAPKVHLLETFYESTRLLLQPRRLVLAVGLGVVSWSGECLALFLVLVGLGLPASFELLIIATFVLATATIVGTLSMLPGGLGAAEAGMAGLLLLLITDPLMTSERASAATLMIRFATLWLGVLVGLVTLILIERHLKGLCRNIQASHLIPDPQEGVEVSGTIHQRADG